MCVCTLHINASVSPSQLDQIELRKVRRASPIHYPTLAIEACILIADPYVFAEPLRAIDLIVADSQIISGYPDDRSLGPESFVLEGSLHELVSFVRCEVFDLVVD